MSRLHDHGCSRMLHCMTPVTRSWGILSAIVTWGVGADVTFHKYNLGIYILMVAVILTFLETAFAVELFLDVCLKDDIHPCLRFWEAVQWLDLWKKSVLYFVMAIFCFIRPSEIWLATIAGIMLMILASFYLILTYKSHLTSGNTLLSDKESSYDRFDELQEEIDDSLPEPSTDNIGDQDRILQV